MDTKLAREAFERAAFDICSLPESLGLFCETKVSFSNADGEEFSDDTLSECIFCKIEISADAVSEKMLFECAVGIFENDGVKTVSDEELLQNIGNTRTLVSEFTEKVKENLSNKQLSDAFLAAIDSEDEESSEKEPPARVRNNKLFYLGVAVGFIAVMLLLILMRRLG